MEAEEEHSIPSMTLRERIWLAAILILAAGMKLWLILGNFVPFNSDEAVVALMARHILEGAQPIFFYGQAYMGSLDAYLVAAGFAIFGQQVWVIRLVQSLLYLGFLLMTFFIGRESFGSARVGLMAASLLAVPTVNVSLYTTATLGGYGEAMLIGSLVVWLAMRIGRSLQTDNKPGSLWLWLLLGLLAGLGLWAFGFSLVFSIPAGVYLLVLMYRVSGTVQDSEDPITVPEDTPFRKIFQQMTNLKTRYRNTFRFAEFPILVSIIGAAVGAVPLILFSLQIKSGVMVQELGGSAIAGVEKVPWIFQVGQHLLSLVVLGGTVIIGARPPWGVEWLALPLLPFVMIFWLVALVYSFRSLGKAWAFPWRSGVVVRGGSDIGSRFLIHAFRRRSLGTILFTAGAAHGSFCWRSDLSG